MGGRLFRIVLALAVASALFPYGMLPAEADSTPLYVTITPVADATVVSSSPDDNFGWYDALYVQLLSREQEQRALIRFNLAAAIPSDAIIDQAWLNLLLWEGGAGDGNIIVSLIVEEWREASVTWNTMPSTGPPVLSRPVTPDVGVKGLEITEIVQA